MKTCTDPLCHVYAGRISLISLFGGNALLQLPLRYSIFGVHILQPENLYCVGPATVLWFARTSNNRLFLPFGYIEDA